MRVDKLIYSIKEAVGDVVDDSVYPDRYIAHLLDTNRAILLHQRLNNYTTAYPVTAVQQLCIELEDADRYKCGIDMDCNDKVRRSVKPLPELFSTVTGKSLVRVRSLDIVARPFAVINPGQVPYLEFSPFSQKVHVFIDDDNYLYVYSLAGAHKFLECVEVSAVFLSPLELENFKNCCGCEETETSTCYSLQSDYPIPGELITPVRDMVLKELVKLREIETDKENDGESL